MRSPLSTTTSGSAQANFTGCGSASGHTREFFLSVPPGVTVTVGQTTNAFDSKHSAFWSEGADPAAYPGSVGGGSCTDDPDTKNVSMANAGSAPRKLWFVVNGFSNYNHEGTFTLAWSCKRGEVATPCAPEQWASLREDFNADPRRGFDFMAFRALRSPQARLAWGRGEAGPFASRIKHTHACAHIHPRARESV